MMMFDPAGSVRQQLLTRPKAEMCFRPWWDTVEDYVLITMLGLGFLTLPTAYVTGNPVECVLHPHVWNTSSLWDPHGVGHLIQEDEYEEDNVGYKLGTVRITHWYVKRYCTEKFVSKFVFYFPYILLIVPLTLVLVDRIFIKTFAAGNKIKQFYELLVEDSLRREDVDTMSRENMRNLHEIMQSFRFSNVCFWSYLSRTCLEIVLSISLFLIYFCWGMPNLEREIECDVHGLRHSCVLPNHQFYFYILAVSSALLCVYILCNVYNLVWIVCPQLGTMYRIIRKYQDHMTDNAYEQFKKKSVLVAGGAAPANHNSGQANKHLHQAISTDNFLAVYFDRRHKDLKLLLNLLAETSGLPESFRILTLFDKKFQSLWKPQNLRFEEYTTVLPSQKIKSHSIIVRWNDAPIGHFLANYDGSLSFEYTIDINPAPQNELGLKSVLYKKDGGDKRRSPSDAGGGGGIGRSGFVVNHRHVPSNRKSSESNNLESFHLLESGRTATATTVVGQSEEDVVVADKGVSPTAALNASTVVVDAEQRSTAAVAAAAAAASSGPSVRDSYRYEVVFDNIVGQEEEYTITISTELNGRTVTQTVEKFPMGTTEGGP